MSTTLLEQTRGAFVCGGGLWKRATPSTHAERRPFSPPPSPSPPPPTALHEEIERLEKAVVDDYLTEARGHAERLAQAHRVRARLDALADRARRAEALYADPTGARETEIAALKGGDAGNPYAAFYARLGEVRAHHAAHPDPDVTPDGGDAPPPVPPFAPPFSGEEAGGRCLDLHEQHRLFLQRGRKWWTRAVSEEDADGAPAGPDYITFARSLADFAAVPRSARRSGAWRAYLTSLATYLESFYDRTQPLASLAALVGPRVDPAASAFDAGTLPGWEDRGLGGPAAVAAAAASMGGSRLALPAPTLDVTAFSSPSELEALGGDALRSALTALSLKAGGTPAQRAVRLWLTRDTPLDQLDRSHFARGAAPPPRAAADPARAAATARATALLEARVAALVSALTPAIEETVAAVERKQARTHEEALADAEEAEAADAAAAGGTAAAPPSDSDEDDFVYNPLKLPLGWDGKPIPYWLYKLHGLNHEFSCEICGGATYRGRREYERHFRDARHAQGMRSLGIPNTKEFFEVVRIDDARALWASLQARKRGDGGGGGGGEGDDEEVEDADGNVYDRRTYEDLKKQGVL